MGMRVKYYTQTAERSSYLPTLNGKVWVAVIHQSTALGQQLPIAVNRGQTILGVYNEEAKPVE